MVCPGCGEKIGDDSRFCAACGYSIDKNAGEAGPGDVTKVIVAKPVTQRTNKIVLYSAIAVVFLVIIGVLWAVTGLNNNGDMEQRKGVDKAAVQADAGPPAQAPQQQYSSEVMQQPSDDSGPVKAAEPSAAGNTIEKPVNALDGRWEGSWTSGFNDSGPCSVTISRNRFSASCYESRFSGRVIGDGRGVIRFEGGNHSWSCMRKSVRHIDRRRTALRCSFSAKRIGAESISGDLNLYR